MNLFLLALVAVLPSVGDVKLECKDPGPWTFEMFAEKAPDGVDVVRVRMKSSAEAVPPKFALKWFVSQRGVHHVWSSESTHYGIPWGEVRISELTSFLPLYAFIGTDDRNRFTFACSESCRRVEFRSPRSWACAP